MHAFDYKYATYLYFHHMYNVHIMELLFDWDEKKSKANQRKHYVPFEEAHTVFYDENAIKFYDPDHSDEEDHFILLGLSFKPQVLVVCHCIRESEQLCALSLLEEQTNTRS